MVCCTGFSIAPDDDESAVAARPWALDHRPGEPAHVAFDCEPRLALAFRARPGSRHRARFWADGQCALPSSSCSTGWRAGFLSRGLSLKSLHRLIVTPSRGLGQSVRHEASFAAIDGDNQWLWRQNRRRLGRGEYPRRDPRPSPTSSTPRCGGPSVQQAAAWPGVHVTPVVDYQPVRLGQPRLMPAVRVSLHFPYAP